MEHYWGVKAIMHRMDIKRPSTFYRYVRKLGLPCYLRVNPKRPINRIMYSNSDLIIAWELGMASQHRERLLALEDDRVPHRLLAPTPEESKARKRKEAESQMSA